MRFTWTVVDAPEGSTATVENSNGTVVSAAAFEYHYLKNETPTFTADLPGTYKLQVTVETVWEDRVSKEVAATAQYEMTLEASGDPVASDDSAGCQMVLNSNTSAPVGALLFMGGFIALVIRRRRR